MVRGYHINEYGMLLLAMSCRVILAVAVVILLVTVEDDSTSIDMGEAKAQFISPHSVHVSKDGFILVADKGNNRIQVF